MEYFDLKHIIMYLISALGAVAVYFSLRIDEGSIYRDQLMGRYVKPKDRIKNGVKNLFYKVILTEEVVKNIGKVGGTTETYIKRFVMFTGGLIFIGMVTEIYFICFLGPIFGWAYSTVGLNRKVKHWRQAITGEIPTLIRMLKIRFAVHDTVPNAVINVEHMLSGPLADEWSKVVADMVNSKKHLDEALDALDERVNIREMTAVVTRLKS